MPWIDVLIMALMDLNDMLRLAVLARNIQILGAKVRQKTLERLKRRKRSSSVYRLAA